MASRFFVLQAIFLFSICTVAAINNKPQFLEHCDEVRHDIKADSIRNLRPDDVSVILSLGDSVTAAFGVEGRKGGFHEFRGKSWAMGGDVNETTLPNFLKFYNPKLIGYSEGKHEAEVCWGPLCHGGKRQYGNTDVDRLNAALSGAMIDNIKEHELGYLYDSLRNDTLIDFENDWKVLTLFIGANDLCSSCRFNYELSANEWEERMSYLLENIKENIPRVMVNVVEIFNVSKVYEFAEEDEYCKAVHKIAFWECDCAFGHSPRADSFRQRMDYLAHIYNERTRKVVKEIENTDTFGVALHRFTEQLDVTNFPIDFISDLDCFHPSILGQQLFAKSLWNSMLTKPEDRDLDIPHMSPKPICPHQNSRFYIG